MCVSDQARNLVPRRCRVNTWEGHSRLYLRCKCQEISGDGRLPQLLANRRRYFATDQPLAVRHNSNGDLEDRLVVSRQQQMYVANTANTNVLSRKSVAIQTDRRKIHHHPLVTGRQVMKAHRALDGQWSASRHGRFTPGTRVTPETMRTF